MRSEYERYIDEQKRSQESHLSRNMAITAGVVGGVVLASNRGLTRTAATTAFRTGDSLTNATRRGFAQIAKQARLSERARDLGSTLSAIDYAIDGKGLSRHLRNPNNFQRRFEEKMRQNLAAQQRISQSVLGGMPTELEKAVAGAISTLQIGAKQIKRDLRYQHFVTDLARKVPQEMERSFANILANQDDRFIENAGRNEIKALLEKYSPENAKKYGYADSISFTDQKSREAFVDQVLTSAKKFQKKGSVRRSEFASAYKSLRDNVFEGLLGTFNSSRESFLNKVLAGADHRPVRLREALNMNLFDPDSMVVGQNGASTIRNANMGQKLRALSKYDDRFLDLVIDSNVFINQRTGQIKDRRRLEQGIYKAVTGFQDHVQVPFLRFNPVDLMHWTTYQSVREAPHNYIFRRGNIDVSLSTAAQTMAKHPMAYNQDAAATPLARSYVQAGENVYDLLSGALVKVNSYLGSARFGMIPRMMASMGNLHQVDYAKSGFLKRLFDVGQQEQPNIFGRTASIFTKHNDPDWEPNALRILANADRDDIDTHVQAYKNLHSFLDTQARPLSDDVSNYLNNIVKESYGELDIDFKKLSDPRETMAALGRIVNGQGKNKAVMTNEIDSMLGGMWRDFLTNEEEFMKSKRILSESSPYQFGILQVVDSSDTELISKVDDVKRLIQQHAIHQVEQRKGITVGQMIQEGIKKGDLDGSAINEIRDLKALSSIRTWWDDIYRGDLYTMEDAAKSFGDTMRRGDASSKAIMESVWDHSPRMAMGPGDRPPQYFGRVGYLNINKAKYTAQDHLTAYNEAISQGFNPLKAGIKAAGLIPSQIFAGRNNLENVTTLTMPGYYFAERLDNALSKVGLGLAQKHRGSMQSILFNQFGRRIALPYMAIQQMQYFDGLTGDYASDQLADAYVNMHQDVSWFKDITGINDIWGHMGSLMPGGEQFWSTPIGGAIKYGSFGFFGDSRSSEEVQEYYESGEDPIRRGRFWGIGSNTPWQGGKIDYFAPNWYRRLKSDYKFSENMYGSESEYWSNHWMPTLTNPLAPIRHFITDPNYYQDKLADERPYPVSGGIPELDMIPLVGGALNNTVGRILNPQVTRPDLEKQHRAYLEELNSYYEAQYEGASGGGYVQTMPAGGYNLMRGSSGVAGESISLSGNVSPGGAYGAGGGGKGGSAAMSNLASINLGISGAALSPVRPITSLDSLRDPNVQADLADIGSPFGLGKLANDSWYSLTEMAGIYGFGLNTIMGYDERGVRPVLENSNRMFSYSRMWWDLEMGGFGGELSEIGRRYNPRDKGNYYNPIRNTMPEWMPGPEYFIDFRHGDPYTKIARGEMRLPGDAYTKLNNLHPDAFGQYGAFDRFKILADVAPYSDQYKFYRRAVSAMNEQGLLTEDMKSEYAEVRDQVSQKKRKYNFYNRRFRDADIETEEVTITDIIDQNTFLTKEYPNNPIRLAGVHIKADAEEAQAYASQFIYEGAQVKVGLDADPLFRVRDDSMDTMRAVVYMQHKDEGRFFYDSNKGQSLNAVLARRDFGSENQVSVSDDGSAVTTRALYDSFDVTVGKSWEWLTHDVIPAIPIVNVVADKFMPIKSPLEMYKEREVYGKSWKPWYDPIGGWIQPMFEKAAAQNPLVAAAGGYGVGWMFGRSAKGRFYGSRLGALTFGLLAAGRVLDEKIGRTLPDSGDGEYAWIPKRRRTEREINEYFDMLKYMKYKGLYEKAREEAIRAEGVDVSQLVSDSTARGEKNKSKREYLETMKKWLSITEKIGYVDGEFLEERTKQVREELKGIDQDRGLAKIGPKSMLALQYKAQYESTLYGADPFGDMTKIFRALPSKDREFFTEFMNASPRDREEILRLVPDNQRRFYQAKWGLELDDKPSLRSYFATHFLPSASWEGWRPDVNLEDIKVKVVRNEGLETTEFGLWEDDVKRAETSDAPEINPFRPSSLLDVTRIEKVLRGAGLRNVSVTMQTHEREGENHIEVGLNLMKDRSKEIVNEINNNMGIFT